MDQWFRQWVEALAQGKATYDEDEVALRCAPQLIRIDSNPDIRRRLRTIYESMLQNSVTDAERRLRQFLVSACIWHGDGSKAKPYRTQKSLRNRELSELAKSARSLAYRIKMDTMQGAVDFGTERLEFLKNRMSDSRTIFPPKDPADIKDYPGRNHSIHTSDNSRLPTLSDLVESFASALDAQAKRDSSDQVRRVTRLNKYVDQLTRYCSLVFGNIDYELVAMITNEVTGKSFTARMVRKRAESSENS